MLGDWIKRAKGLGAKDARIINPKELICGEWVRLKCQYGCIFYDSNYCCPSSAPHPEVSKKIFNEYSRGLLIEFEPLSSHSDIMDYIKYNNFITNTTSNMEREMFLDGWPQVFSMNSGPCFLCSVIKNGVFRKYKCSKDRGKFTFLLEHLLGFSRAREVSYKNLTFEKFKKRYSKLSLSGWCRYPDIARPAMEAMGIDVFQTVKKFGFDIFVCDNYQQLPHYFSLILID